MQQPYHENLMNFPQILFGNPRISFGKKCSVTEDNSVAYSYVWLYNKESGLDADKETCAKLD